MRNKIQFCTADKQSCLVAHVYLTNTKATRKIQALIKTAYIFDGKYGKLQDDTNIIK